ncbi:hypothetical protein CNR22_04930 [Sphingobacteriaceae bacterium]|nr:hypothetical protein CNR22_04930 [Sphingobacteriaceae bacterium]
MAISKLKKRSLIALGSIVVFVLIVIACLSPIAKYFVQKYDVSLIMGREITVETAYVNPFTGYVRFGGLKIFEANSDSVFIGAESLSGNFSLIKLLFHELEISDLTLTDPKAHVIQNKKILNFDDIIQFYKPKHPKTKKKKKPLIVNLPDMQIVNATFIYLEKSIPVNYSIKKFNARSPGLIDDSDSMSVKFDFFSGNDKGDMKGDLVVNKENADYSIAAKVNKYDIGIIEQYLKDLSNYGKFRANVDADFKASGNFKKVNEINTSGLFAVNDLHVGKSREEDYVAFEKFTIQIEQLNPSAKKYLFDSLSLIKPYAKFELYDYLNNIEMMFGKGGNKAVEHSEFNIIVEIGKYIEQLSKNFLKSDYKINRLAIYQGDFKYNDFTLGEKFSVSANPVYILADSIKRDNKPVEFSLRTGIKPYGEASVKISINPKDSSDFDVHYDFKQIPITLFNPYLIRYTSFPLDRGTLELKGDWRVRNGIINAQNRLTIIDPRIYRRIRGEDNKWLPMHLITYFVRERGNVIDYEVPIKGNLKDPKFKFKDVILDVATNIFVKPVSAAYITKVRSVEKEIEKSRVLRWEMRQNTLSPDQENFLEELSEFLVEDPKVVLHIKQLVYAEKEKEYILLFEAKKRYYLHKYNRKANQLSEDENEEIEKMSIKDSLFVAYLKHKTKDPMLFTVQAKCLALIGQKEVDAKFNELLKERESAFLAYFKEKDIAKRIKINPMEDKIPYAGFSAYRIDYKGELPKELEHAMNKMNDLNNQNPRKKFKKDRDTRRSLIRANNRRKKK